MRLRIIVHVLGFLSLFVAIGVGVAALVAWGYGGDDLVPLALGALVPFLAGSVAIALTRGVRGQDLGVKEGFAIVAAGWFLACLFGALPYALYPRLGRSMACEEPQLAGSEFCSWTNCLFESTSGFTTTGSSILSHGLWPDPRGPRNPTIRQDVRAFDRLLPHGILFWRALTHWYGGMGIIVLSLAILPYLGIGGMQLYRAEVPGPTSDKLVPRLADTAKILWLVYVGLSVIETGLLMWPGGMDWYNAVTHTFATMATGGFSTLAESVGGFHSVTIETVINVFMFLAGTNFTLHFLAIRGDWRVFGRDSEFRLYAGATAGLIALLTALLLWHGHVDGPLEGVRQASFQVLAILTTTGFATVDFAHWIPAAQYVLLLLMFVGGCAGSTGGGPKVLRLLTLGKMAFREVVRVLHPKAVLKVRINHRPVDEPVLAAIVGFMLFYMALFGVSSLVLAAFGMDIVSATTAVAANLGNVGPGLGSVGPAANYDHLALPTKWLLTFLMVVGRLEVFTVLVLFSRSFWKR